MSASPASDHPLPPEARRLSSMLAELSRLKDEALVVERKILVQQLALAEWYDKHHVWAFADFEAKPPAFRTTL